MKCFPDVLLTKYAVNFATYRADWSVYENFEDMYKFVYKYLAELGHTEELAEPEWQNVKGERVSSEEEALGMQVTQ